MSATRATLWAALALLVLFGTQIVAAMATLTLYAVAEGAKSEEEFQQLAESLPLVGPDLPLSLLIAAPLVYFVVRRATKPLDDGAAYLGVVKPRGGFLAALAVAAGYWSVSLVLDAVLDRPAILELSRQLVATKEALGIVVVWLAVAVAGPVSEELIYRGLLLPAWVSSVVGRVGACAAVSLVWSATHVQYELSYQVEIFLVGMALAFLRLRYQSLMIPLTTHAAINGMAILLADPDLWPPG